MPTEPLPAQRSQSNQDADAPAYEPALALAKWTQHFPDCARATTTAANCTCGLQEAWNAIYREPV